MEPKTKTIAEEGKQDLMITREFDLPVELLFKAHVDPELLVQWKAPSGTTGKILKFAGKKHGNYRFEITDANGKVVAITHGVIHEFIPDRKIIRTFEVENSPMGVQLEIYDFEKLTPGTSKLHMHVIYESVALRDSVVMHMGPNLCKAHDHMEEIVSKLK
jgi:uncharacterized protein YndB with AHSA1/START domain